MRRYGTPPDPEQIYRDRPGAYGAILKDGEMLVTLEHRPGLGLEIALPGGGIDPGESPLQALHREVMEETGWRIAPLRRLGAYQRYCYMPEYDLWARKICLIYLCHAVHRIGPPLEAEHMPLWTTPDVALEMLSNPADGAFLSDHL